MIRFPFLGYPYPYHYYKYYPSSPLKNVEPPPIHEETIKINPKKEDRKIPSKSNPISFHFEGFSDPNQVILEILGIKLYLDDIIILGLLFILYTEEVKDEMLFICLLLLLLS